MTNRARTGGDTRAPASRKVASVTLAVTVVLCALAPLNGVSFALAGLTAFGLKELPARVRIFVMAASLGVFLIGVFEVATDGSRTVILSP